MAVSKNLSTSTYSALLAQLRKVFIQGLKKVEEEKVRTYWTTGKLIAEHLLANKERADYGASLYENLSKDLGIDASTLQRTTRFYRAYPILVPGRELTWTHYRKLITIKDDSERKKLETEILQKDWGAQELQDRLNQDRLVQSLDPGPGKPIPELKFSRGTLFTYSVADKAKVICPKGRVVLDLGFNIWRFVKQEETKDIVLTDKPQYAYAATVERVVDGDTLWAQIDCGFDNVVRQKLRLWGIDCPEVDTDRGKRAQSFVRKRLFAGSTIVIRTSKSDKYDRYLADVFYLEGETDPVKIAEEGIFLNQELLNERLAVPMSG